jgi:arginase
MHTAERRVEIIGAPTSAGAYAPGQEQAPAALRAAGLIQRLSERDISVIDRGDLPSFRWRIDPTDPRAMNLLEVLPMAQGVRAHVADALRHDSRVLVLGGDCTVELGSVAGAVDVDPSVGLVYIDLDTDLNTPDDVDDGALDWMGVAHLLALPGSRPSLSGLGARHPLLQPEQLLFFANDNSTPHERKTMRALGLAEEPLPVVVKDPAGVGRRVAETWGRQFGRLLIHLDVDVLDYLDLPVAENTRRNRGLRLEQLTDALGELVTTPNWSVLTICEVNPDHAESDGASIDRLVDMIVQVVARGVGTPTSRESK